MQYADLVQFESLEAVIKIREAGQIDKARQLVSTYVISANLADRLIHLVLPQLQFNQPKDNKGLLIIGNYGTGKSHLMAVISSIAENALLVDYLNHSQVAKAIRSIAGQFHVLRIEIGATTMSLRDIVTRELETYLGKVGIYFQFPDPNTITNNKVAFEKMMATFVSTYPNHGLLLVIDELLEYLSARKDQELIFDLNFLREIGEICQNLRLRFIAGLQETLFDNQRFAFVANALRRVKDRFEQILITRQDIKFVVAKRLLTKNHQQQEKIQAYLNRFIHCYSNMNERLAEFVSLFPIHPDYIDTFERITLLEKREILKTLATHIQALLNTEVPSTYPGLVSYDSYWQILRENPAFRALPDIREVIECSQVLENKLTQTVTRPIYKPMAIRIISGLSVHRLTTHNIDAPVGMTAQELRDSLCLYYAGIEELGGHPADNLLTLIESVLQEMLRIVNRQFITINPENGQYYIDLNKHFDFDAIIEARAASLDTHQLDRYYYAALRQVMEISDQPTIKHQNFSWLYELEWRSHQVTRQGYLVFSAPNSTTMHLVKQDEGFLLYFLPLYQLPTPPFSDLSSKATLFFQLTKIDEIFIQTLRLYGAASDLVSTSSEPTQSVYEAKSQTYLRDVVQWLQEHKPTAFEVTYQGRTQTLLDWTTAMQGEDLRIKNNPSLFMPHPSLLENFRDLIDLVADICLDNYFSELAPEYPRFPLLVSHENLASMTQEALRGIVSSKPSRPAQGILAALELLDEQQQINPSHSKYAQAILKLLHHKSVGQVLDRSEILAGNYFAPTTYRLESELTLVLIAALVSVGEVILVTPTQRFDVMNCTTLAHISIKELLSFKQLEKPKPFNLVVLTALVECLALPKGLETTLINYDRFAVPQLQAKVSELLDRLVSIQPMLVTGFIFWGKPVLNPTEIHDYQDCLGSAKTFLESLQAYSAPLKFKNFRYTVAEIVAQQHNLKCLQDLLSLQTLLTDLSQPVAYLTTAETVLPPQHPWLEEISQVRQRVLSRLRDAHQRNSNGFGHVVQQQLNRLQKNYVTIYLNLHQQARLGTEEEQTQSRLRNDNRYLNLKPLVQIELLPHQQLHDWVNQLNQLQTCYELQESDLRAQAICPHCGYKPIFEDNLTTLSIRLVQFDQTLDHIYHHWTQTLLTELELAAEGRELLKPENRVQLDTFLTTRVLPNNITPSFVEALQEGLSRLIKVTVNIEDLQQALQTGGTPTTVIEMQKRFNHYLHKLTQDQDVSKVRMVLE